MCSPSPPRMRTSPSMLSAQCGAGVVSFVACFGQYIWNVDALNRHPTACAHTRW